jgi:hypothetical protein
MCSFLFFLAIVISWVMRDFARPLLEKIPCKQQAQQNSPWPLSAVSAH